MPQTGFESVIPEWEGTQTHALHRPATEMGKRDTITHQILSKGRQHMGIFSYKFKVFCDVKMRLPSGSEAAWL
jgi:hypothetical protein